MQSPGKGYGLFAEKEYRGSLDDVGEYVTTYGGTPLGGYMQGPYILEIRFDYSIDGHHGFALSEKGRWMNNDSQNFNVYWARDRVYVYTPESEYLHAPVIEKGAEILVNYGDEYEKPWEEREERFRRWEKTRKRWKNRDDSERMDRWEQTRKKWVPRDNQDFE
jgi:hypothetical protein